MFAWTLQQKKRTLYKYYEFVWLFTIVIYVWEEIAWIQILIYVNVWMCKSPMDKKVIEL